MEGKIRTIPEHAEKLTLWIKERGGIALWGSVNLSNPEASWTTPVLDEKGLPVTKPSWQAASTPMVVVRDLKNVDVQILKEVARFKVAVRRGDQGLNLKLTDHSSKKLRNKLDAAGEGASYYFDYERQEAVISVPEKVIPLDQFLAEKDQAG
jgi:hypothetical protein